MPLTFIHTADWHLGKPFHGISDDDKRAAVRTERFEAIRRVGQIARERHAAFVLVAGDAFDSPHPTRDVISAGLDAIGSIGIPVYMIPGNHDHGGPGTLWSSDYFSRERDTLASNLHVLLAASPIILEDAAILPCPLLRKFEAEDPTSWIRAADYGALGDLPRIALAHGGTISFEDSFDEEESATPARHIQLEGLPWEEIDYMALGDYHGFMAVGNEAKAWYSGSHEIDRFPKTDQRPGHVACVTVNRGRAPHVEALDTGKFRWFRHEIRLGESVDRLDEELRERTRESGLLQSLMAITIRGSMSLDARRRLDECLDTWKARLVRFDVTDEVVLEPTQDEIKTLAQSADDPIIAGVASRLGELLTAQEDEAATAAEALRILHGLCSARGS
jgi:DNA repair exonuclease SbcCD nuclease subunit